jgi:hypothetical protein
MGIEHSDSLCGQRESDAYHRGWSDCQKFIAEQQAARLSNKAQRTSKAAVARNADAIKGIQKDVLTALQGNPLGLTDFDLESALGRTHQSVSAARNALMMSGLVTDSGKTRPNARGNASIVWMLSSPSSEETHADDDDVDDRPACTECGTTNCSRRRNYPYCYGSNPKRDDTGFARDISDKGLW